VLVAHQGTSDTLDQLLAEPVADAVMRERTTFDVLAERHGVRDVVLVGAGGLGRRVARSLQSAGVGPLAFADNDARRWGAVVEGVSVYSPAEAARAFGRRAVFVVTIWGAGSPHRYGHSRAQLESLGCAAVSPFPPLLWRTPGDALPHYCQDLPHRVIEQAPSVVSALALWADDASRREYLSQVRFRLLADFDGLSSPVAHPQYFPPDLLDFSGGEVFVDCGAFTGDTLRSFLTAGHRLRRAIALEPDPANLVALRHTLAELDIASRVAVHAVGAGSTRAQAWMDAGGTAASAIVHDDGRGGGTPIEIVPLDDLLVDERPTFVKMDIEGAEPEALLGAVRTLSRDRPALAVSAYHLQDHLWRIPLQLSAMTEDYRFFCVLTTRRAGTSCVTRSPPSACGRELPMGETTIALTRRYPPRGCPVCSARSRTGCFGSGSPRSSRLPFSAATMWSCALVAAAATRTTFPNSPPSTHIIARSRSTSITSEMVSSRSSTPGGSH
jgi:FkbM family methyltransferase